MAGRMDVDPPIATTCVTSSGSTLKRSNSAPMINILGIGPSSTPSTTHSTITCTVSTVSTTVAQPGCSHWALKPVDSHHRMRRYSTSSTGLHSPTAPMKVPSRLNQIKQEATGLGVLNREVAHEREVHSNIQLSSSCEDLSLEEPIMQELRRPKSFNEQLHIFTPPYSFGGSPSPTRVGKQCFSPSLGQPVRNETLTPSPSPSPTRKVFRTSLSPIAVRPSQFGLKRKIDLDNSERYDNYCSQPKRISLCSTPDRPAMTHPLVHSISSSSMEDSSSSGSPDQTVPMGTPAKPRDCVMNTGTTLAPNNNSFSFRPVTSTISIPCRDLQNALSDPGHTPMSTDASENVKGHPSL